MYDFPYLTLMLLLPMLGALLVVLTPKERESTIRMIAGVCTFAAMLVSMHVYRLFLELPDAAQRATFQFVERHEWIRPLGISYIVGIDGLNAPMVLLAGLLGFSVSLVSCNIKTRVKEYYVLALASIAGVFGIFMSLDLFFFILFYEMASVPVYFLVGMWGSTPKTGARMSLQAAATKLIIYLQLGGGLAFLGILGIYFAAQPHTFDLTQLIPALAKTPLPHTIQMWLFPLVFLGFAIEAGFFPFHTWLPDGHSSAPTALSMLLAGVLLKMGSYGALRLGVCLMPDGAGMWMPYFMLLAVANVLYGALAALHQSDIKYFIAFSSVSHMGIVILGMGSGNALGLQGAVYQMFSHGVVTALMFALAGYVYEKTHTRNLDEMGGLAFRMPVLAAAFTMAGMASLGLPGMSGFVAETMVFMGLYTNPATQTLALLAVLGLVITATYILRAVQRMLFGPIKRQHQELGDLVGIEPYPVALLTVTMLVFGFWPRLLIDSMAPSIDVLVRTLGGH